MRRSPTTTDMDYEDPPALASQMYGAEGVSLRLSNARGISP